MSTVSLDIPLGSTSISSPGFTYAGIVKSSTPVNDSDVVVVSSSFLQEAAEKMKIAAAARSIVFLKSIALKLFSPKWDIQITNIGNFQQKPVHLCKYFAAGE